jgi:hypothetical protein
MSEIKSAWEKAMEKADKLGKLSPDELQQMEYRPTGNKIAAQYLQDERFDLDTELTKYKGTGGRKHIIQGAQETFIRNITLPHDEHSINTINRSLEGIRLLKENKKQIQEIYDRLNNLLNYYQQARQQAFTQFKQEFESKVQEIGVKLQQRPGMNAQTLEAELQRQFQEEWHRISSQLDAQYEKTLEEQKQQILDTA